MTVRLTIPGKPVGKGRPRFRRAGNFVQTYTPEATANYETLVKWCWQERKLPKLSGELSASVRAFFPIPKSTTKKRRLEMIGEAVGYTGKPDLDNIAKCVLDALNGLAYDDDSQVVQLTVTKHYSEEPRCVVELEEVGTG